MEKETIFNIIDEYMDLEHEDYVIKFDKANESKGLSVMLSLGKFGSHQKGEYSINGLIKRRLDKNKIKYKIIEFAKPNKPKKEV